MCLTMLLTIFDSCTRGMEMGILYKFNMNCQLLRVVYSSQVLVAAFAVSSLEIVLMARGVYFLLLPTHP